MIAGIKQLQIRTIGDVVPNHKAKISDDKAERFSALRYCKSLRDLVFLESSSMEIPKASATFFRESAFGIRSLFSIRCIVRTLKPECSASAS